MGMVHGVQKGTVKKKDVSKKVKDVAKNIDPDDAEDFASTEHKGLPNKVKKENALREIIRRIIIKELNN